VHPNRWYACAKLFMTMAGVLLGIHIALGSLGMGLGPRLFRDLKAEIAGTSTVHISGW
jgi:hypothetical protein